MVKSIIFFNAFNSLASSTKPIMKANKLTTIIKLKSLSKKPSIRLYIKINNKIIARE